VDHVVVTDVDIVLMIQNILWEKWLFQKKYLNLRIMNLEQLKQETDNLKQINTAQLSQEQLLELIDKLALIIDTGEKQLSEIKIETDEG
jgi:hypothetical protein